MPRWPKEEGELKLVPPPEERAEGEETPVLLPLAENALHNKIDNLSDQVQLLVAHLASFGFLNAAEQSSVKLQRRRTEDEMRRALSLLTTPGAPRQRDDECEEILTDAIGEVIALRQITMDVMQTITTAHQNGLAAIRKLTER